MSQFLKKLQLSAEQHDELGALQPKARQQRLRELYWEKYPEELERMRRGGTSQDDPAGTKTAPEATRPSGRPRAKDGRALNQSQ